MVKGAVANNDIDLIAFTSPIDPADAEGFRKSILWDY